MSESQNASTTPEWEQRFRAPRVSLPDWAEEAPDRSLFVSNATGPMSCTRGTARAGTNAR